MLVISEGEITGASISELEVRFSEPVQDPPGSADPDDVTNPDNYLLFSDGGDGFQTVTLPHMAAIQAFQE